MNVSLTDDQRTMMSFVNSITLCTVQKRQSLHVCLRTGSVSAERVGQEEVGGVTCRVLCTWWLLGLAIVLTITCSLISGCGQSHETAY